MDQGIENMSMKQLQELVREKQNQLTSLEQTNQILIKEKHTLGHKNNILTKENAIRKAEIDSYEQKTRVLEEKK